jgi:colanic acid/amylovoran biosynthesis glycosyltransferase
MRIAFFVGVFPVLSETFVLDQIVGLIDKGHEVDIFATGKPKQPDQVHPVFREYQLQQRTYYRPPMPENLLLRFISGLILLARYIWVDPDLILRSLNFVKYGKPSLSLRILFSVISHVGKQKYYDIIHCHFGMHGLIAMYMKQLGAIKGPILVTFHGYDVNGWPKQYGSQSYQELFNYADQFTANTRYTAQKAINLSCDPERIKILPVGVNLDLFPYQERALYPEKKIEILTVGRLVEKKGIAYSIRAMKVLKEKELDFRYRIIGEGPLRDQLQQLISDLGLENQVFLLGGLPRDQVIKLYQETDLFVLASVTAQNGDQEGQGLVLQEAQAMGIPVISTLHNGIPDGVKHGETGFLAPEKDSQSLADYLLHLIQNPDEYKTMSRSARQFIEAEYDIHHLLNQLIDIYHNFIHPESIKPEIKPELVSQRGGSDHA